MEKKVRNGFYNLTVKGGGFIIPLVGHAYDVEMFKQAKKLEVGNPVKIRPEPANKHDPYALKVFINDRPIGYLPKMVAKAVMPVWDQLGIKVVGVKEYYDPKKGNTGLSVKMFAWFTGGGE